MLSNFLAVEPCPTLPNTQLQALRKLKNLCQLYFSAPFNEKREEEQISFLLIRSGDKGRELVST